MVHLRNITGETVCLKVQAGMQNMNLEEVQSHEHVRFTEGKGHLLPLYAGASGKTMLAQFSAKNIEIYIKNIDLIPMGPNTITSKKALMKEIRKVSKQGFAVSIGEGISWGASIAVPIRRYILPAAMCIVGPKERWKPKALDFVQPLKEARDRIEIKLSS